MKQTKVELFDDIDGKRADRTIQFSFDGKSYEIDLSKTNANKMEKARKPYIDRATRVRGAAAKQRKTRNAGAKSESATIRSWAQENGITVSDRGKIPQTVVDQFHAAHA